MTFPSGKNLFIILLFVGSIIVIISLAAFQNVDVKLAGFVAQIEVLYQEWLENQNKSNPFILIIFAFFGGLIASISPCVLSMLPVNLSYIGTLKITSRRDAFFKASFFSLGAVTLFSLIGLFASFTSVIFIEFRGYINIFVGVIILLMGLSFAGLIHLPLPQTHVSFPIAGSYGVGLTFALVSSPCSSPVLFAVLAAAAATGSQLYSTITMVSYALGYTAVIFLASLFTGLVKQSRVLLSKSDWIIRLGSFSLILAGGYYLFMGVTWFL
ncbi:MAG: cytochrome c biogenesis protein CcdA [Scytonematopsis contorta HA4267-MV1]|jgi:cytochrome c-type biogenesis protein|nr:cytochrome c biogenesis protein CcdA [Scytonematopsis contorta HA4267-MV1]